MAEGTSSNRVLVTGAGGFIGRTVCAQLVERGSAVVGLDSRLGEARQSANLAGLTSSLTKVIDDDLLEVDLRALLDGVDAVVHLAGSPGVQSSWSTGFDHHVRNNVVTTQRLLEAALDAPVSRIVVASSSSIYGNVVRGLAIEDSALAPLSPYGASKAAMEHVVGAYVERGLPVTPVRFFTVYGPHQRPDMAIHRMIEAAVSGVPFPLRGDGNQSRNFTFVDDAARAVVRLVDADPEPGRAFNVGGVGTHSVNELLATVGDVIGRDVPVERVVEAPGDPLRTAADTTRIREEIGWEPLVDLRRGVERQVHWQCSGRGPGVAVGYESESVRSARELADDAPATMSPITTTSQTS